MTILVLEEVETDLPHHQRILETIPGVRVALSSDPAQAQKAFVEHKVDLVVVDDAIVGNALPFLKQIHLASGRRDAPVIMLVANGDKDARRSAYEYGVYNVIEKPIDPATYLCVARNALSFVVLRRNDATAAAQVADGYKKLQEQIEERETQVLYSVLHAANLADEALSRRMARVATVAQKMAARTSLSPDEAKRIGVAARVYDIGMLALPPNVRERRLELAGDDAAKLLGAHTTRAHEVFAKERSGLIDLAATIARQHHERFDGRGYPDGLKGTNISVYAQLVNVAETFVDLVTTGVGRNPAPMSEQQALQVVDRQTGTAFDPEVVEALRRLVMNPTGASATAPV